MGAGKSVVGIRLAQEIGWDFIDLDAEIVSIAGKSIAEIFQQSGEARFRELEHDTLKEALQRPQTVVALGGGAIESTENRRLLFADRASLLVYLEAPLELLLQRCVDQYESDGYTPRRPVLENRLELKQRFQRRQPLYETAHVTISTAECGVEEVASRIVKEWKRRATPQKAR